MAKTSLGRKNFQLHVNLMGPQSRMWSVVDINVHGTGLYPEAELLDHMGFLVFMFEEAPYSFQYWLHQFTFPQHCTRLPLSPHSGRNFLVLVLSTAILTGMT